MFKNHIIKDKFGNVLSENDTVKYYSTIFTVEYDPYKIGFVLSNGTNWLREWYPNNCEKINNE